MCTCMHMCMHVVSACILFWEFVTRYTVLSFTILEPLLLPRIILKFHELGKSINVVLLLKSNEDASCIYLHRLSRGK